MTTEQAILKLLGLISDLQRNLEEVALGQVALREALKELNPSFDAAYQRHYQQQSVGELGRSVRDRDQESQKIWDELMTMESSSH